MTEASYLAGGVLTEASYMAGRSTFPRQLAKWPGSESKDKAPEGAYPCANQATVSRSRTETTILAQCCQRFISSCASRSYHDAMMPPSLCDVTGERGEPLSPASLARLSVDDDRFVGRDVDDRRDVLRLRLASLARLAPRIEVERLAVTTRVIRGGDGGDLLVAEQPARTLHLRVARVVLAQERTNERLADLLTIRCASELFRECVRRDGVVLGHDDMPFLLAWITFWGKPSLNAGSGMTLRSFVALPPCRFALLPNSSTSRHECNGVTQRFTNPLHIERHVTQDNTSRVNTDNTCMQARQHPPVSPLGNTLLSDWKPPQMYQISTFCSPRRPATKGRIATYGA